MTEPSPGQQRFRSLETQSPGAATSQKTAASADVAKQAGLAEEERKALGPLAGTLEDLLREAPKDPTLAEWRRILEAVKREAARQDLTLEEKKQRLRDIYLQVRRSPFRRRLRVAVIAAIVVTALLLLL